MIAEPSTTQSASVPCAGTDTASWIRRHALKFRERLEHKIILDSSKKGKVVLGVMHSPRLGTSLRINNIRCTSCTYNCVYCENGGPAVVSTVRRECLSPYELYIVVKKTLEELAAGGTHIDWLSFNPTSEPTIDIALWREIGLLRDLGIPIAVFTNASLLWNPLVQDGLHCADYVSVKVDSVDEDTWRRINRPHTCLSLGQILSGITEFSRTYAGTLTTETMFVRGMNDSMEDLERTGAFLRTLKRSHSYFMTPGPQTTADPACAPDAAFMASAAAYIRDHIPAAELVSLPMEHV